MRSYQLENKSMDEEFLKGRTISCRVAFHPGREEEANIDDSLLVILSTGKKFKGKVTQVRYLTLDPYVVGEIDIVRTGL